MLFRVKTIKFLKFLLKDFPHNFAEILPQTVLCNVNRYNLGNDFIEYYYLVYYYYFSVLINFCFYSSVLYLIILINFD